MENGLWLWIQGVVGIHTMNAILFMEPWLNESRLVPYSV